MVKYVLERKAVISQQKIRQKMHVLQMNTVLVSCKRSLTYFVVLWETVEMMMCFIFALIMEIGLSVTKILVEIQSDKNTSVTKRKSRVRVSVTEQLRTARLMAIQIFNQSRNILHFSILDNAPQMHLIPEAKAFSDRNFGTVIASDHFCPNGGKPFALNMIEWPRFVTCHCEDHCNWYKCRLEKPPSECLNGVNASWKWDKKGHYWVAQMNSVNQTGNVGQIEASIF